MENKIKIINLFSVGDADNISSWSNIPFFFKNNLEKKGITVNKVNISPSYKITKLFNLTIAKFLKTVLPESSFDYFRSYINYFFTELKILFATQKYDNSCFNIFLSFSFSSPALSKKKSIQLCDWTYEHDISYFKERKPDFLEKRAIRRENNQIEKSSLVISLFPGVANYMKNHYNNKNIFYIGNVVNSFIDCNSNTIENKNNSFELLFIGAPKYLSGAKQLISVFDDLAKDIPQLKLNIVGINKEEFDNLSPNISCFGYLDKIKDGKTFYTLLNNAKVFINSSPKWAAFSAAVEAMYHYTPVIITHFDEFVETFGENINFGYYLKDSSSETLKRSIQKILKTNEYKNMCISANTAVKDFSWEVFTDKFISKMNSLV